MFVGKFYPKLTLNSSAEVARNEIVGGVFAPFSKLARTEPAGTDVIPSVSTVCICVRHRLEQTLCILVTNLFACGIPAYLWVF